MNKLSEFFSKLFGNKSKPEPDPFPQIIVSPDYSRARYDYGAPIGEKIETNYFTIPLLFNLKQYPSYEEAKIVTRFCNIERDAKTPVIPNLSVSKFIVADPGGWALKPSIMFQTNVTPSQAEIDKIVYAINNGLEEAWKQEKLINNQLKLIRYHRIQEAHYLNEEY